MGWPQNIEMATRQLEHGEAVGGNDSRPGVAGRHEAIEDALMLLPGCQYVDAPVVGTRTKVLCGPIRLPVGHRFPDRVTFDRADQALLQAPQPPLDIAQSARQR